MNDAEYMAIALDLAEKGRGFTSPNPMVGAVVVRDDTIVGKGYHEAVGGPHGEINALDDAGKAAENACLYVTLEPCNHTGRTPPCTERILESGVSRVVIAMADPNPDVKGNGAAYLAGEGVDIRMGVCEDRSRRLNESYIQYVLTKRPFVTMKCAATLDGYIATRSGDSKWISGETSRRYVHELRHGTDAILVGIGTVEADDPRLTTRLEGKEGKDPIRVVLDTNLRIPPNANVLRLESDSDTLLITGNRVEEGKKARIERLGARVIPLDRNKDGRIDFSSLIAALGKLQITSLLIEGGSTVFGSALSAGAIDKLILFYGPKLLGGSDGIPVFRGRGPEAVSGSIPMKDIRHHRFDDDLMVEGYL